MIGFHSRAGQTETPFWRITDNLARDTVPCKSSGAAVQRYNLNVEQGKGGLAASASEMCHDAATKPLFGRC